MGLHSSESGGFVFLSKLHCGSKLGFLTMKFGLFSSSLGVSLSVSLGNVLFSVLECSGGLSLCCSDGLLLSG
jgi:hypothetical protein